LCGEGLDAHLSAIPHLLSLLKVWTRRTQSINTSPSRSLLLLLCVEGSGRHARLYLTFCLCLLLSIGRGLDAPHPVRHTSLLALCLLLCVVGVWTCAQSYLTFSLCLLLCVVGVWTCHTRSLLPHLLAPLPSSCSDVLGVFGHFATGVRHPHLLALPSLVWLFSQYLSRICVLCLSSAFLAQYSVRTDRLMTVCDQTETKLK
jgi:hypothetical protein